MIDFRLYRVAWLPALAAFVTMMFSLEGVPEPIEPQLAPSVFDGRRALVNTRQLLAEAPDRSAGSEGDAAVADFVEERFSAIEAGTTSEQTFDAEVGGEDVELRNVILSLPGETDRTILVMAARDGDGGGAATGTLVELAENLGGSDHAKTIVVVSTSGGAAGAAGAAEFVDSYPARESIEAAVVIAQPGSASPREPYVLRHSTDDASTSIQLVRTAEQAVEAQAGRKSTDQGPFGELSRLALPAAIGEQAVLIERGLDAVAISSAGERPVHDDELNAESLAGFGSAALAVVLAIDQSSAGLEHGPDAYVGFSGSLVPGWAIALLALALLLPAAVAALDGVARAARRRAGVLRALAWAFALGLPLVAALIAIYLLALVGLVPSPAYPFDPGRLDASADEILALLVIAAVAVGGYGWGGLRHLPARARHDALVPALGAAACASALVCWLLDPYLALFLAPAAHVWLVAVRDGRQPVVAAAVCVSLLPGLVALLSAAGAVSAGLWDIVLMVADGHISSITALALCPLAGALVGLLIVAWGASPGPRAKRESGAPAHDALGASPQEG